MSRRRPLALLASTAIVLAACGSTDEGGEVGASEPAAGTIAEPADESAAEPASEPAAEPAAEPAPADTDDAQAEEPAAEPTAEEPAPEPEAEPAADSEQEPLSEPAEEPAPEPEAEPMSATDGCSTDGSPTLVESADGPAPAIDIRPESAEGPLIDLAVRRINCAGGWANLRNEIPADRPVLVWFWAPH